jgi:hypothetical protein
MILRKISGLTAAAVFGFALSVYSSIVYLKVFTFNDSEPLSSWSKMIINGEVNYLSMKLGNDGFVRAVSDKTCSALYYRLKYKAEEYPLLFWKWRVVKFPRFPAGQNDRDMDDYAARMYVVFPFLSFSSSKFIEYVWSEYLPSGTVIDNPKAKNVKIIVVRNGRASGREWASESRNIYKDYIEAFGEKPRLKVGAVAIMCDADQSKSEAESLFDEIAVGKE